MPRIHSVTAFLSSILFLLVSHELVAKNLSEADIRSACQGVPAFKCKDEVSAGCDKDECAELIFNIERNIKKVESKREFDKICVKGKCDNYISYLKNFETKLNKDVEGMKSCDSNIPTRVFKPLRENDACQKKAKTLLNKIVHLRCKALDKRYKNCIKPTLTAMPYCPLDNDTRMLLFKPERRICQFREVVKDRPYKRHYIYLCDQKSGSLHTGANCPNSLDEARNENSCKSLLPSLGDYPLVDIQALLASIDSPIKPTKLRLIQPKYDLDKHYRLLDSFIKQHNETYLTDVQYIQSAKHIDHEKIAMHVWFFDSSGQLHALKVTSTEKLLLDLEGWSENDFFSPDKCSTDREKVNEAHWAKLNRALVGEYKPLGARNKNGSSRCYVSVADNESTLCLNYVLTEFNNKEPINNIKAWNPDLMSTTSLRDKSTFSRVLGSLSTNEPLYVLGANSKNALVVKPTLDNATYRPVVVDKRNDEEWDVSQQMANQINEAFQTYNFVAFDENVKSLIKYKLNHPSHLLIKDRSNKQCWLSRDNVYCREQGASVTQVLINEGYWSDRIDLNKTFSSAFERSITAELELQWLTLIEQLATTKDGILKEHWKTLLLSNKGGVKAQNRTFIKFENKECQTSYYLVGRDKREKKMVIHSRADSATECQENAKRDYLAIESALCEIIDKSLRASLIKVYVGGVEEELLVGIRLIKDGGKKEDWMFLEFNPDSSNTEISLPFNGHAMIDQGFGKLKRRNKYKDESDQEKLIKLIMFSDSSEGDTLRHILSRQKIRFKAIGACK